MVAMLFVCFRLFLGILNLFKTRGLRIHMYTYIMVSFQESKS